MFSTNLTVGSTGSDVVALQTWLIANGYSIPSIASGAAAKGYFGSQTLAAVKAYQTAKGIPSTGFVGPLTRGALNAGGGVVVTPGVVTCPVGYNCTPTSGGAPIVSTSGMEGQLKTFDLLGSVSSETVDENESGAKVLGFEFEAEDSDMTIDRVDVDFTAPASGSDDLADYIESVSLWLGSTKLATLSVNDADEDDDVFSFRFSGLKAVVQKDQTANMYVAVDAVNNVDSLDTGSWDVEIPADGIRATDSAGISDTYVSANVLEEDFTVGDSNGGELDITENNDSPNGGIITVSEDNDTTDVTLLIIDLEADESDINIEQIPVSIVANSGTSISSVVKSLKLVRGSTVLKSKSIPSTALSIGYEVVFNDLDIDIEEGDVETLKIVADLNDLEVGSFDEGDSVYATTTGSDSSWSVEDANNDNVNPDGSVTGEAQSFYQDGIVVSLVGTPDASSEDGLARFEINFSVKASGSDAYISDNAPDAILAATTPTGTNVGIQYSTSTTAGVAFVQSTDLAGTINSGDVAGSYFKVNKGQTRSFSLIVEASNTSTSVYASSAVALRSINWSTTTAAASFINHYTFDLGAFLTPTETWRTQP